MTTPTDAAIAALLKQVQTLTETVTAQSKRLDDLHEFNTKILDEKKDAKRALDAAQSNMTPEQIANLQSMGFEKADDGNWYPAGSRGAHEITRADARDPAKYRAAKLAAERAGKTLSIIDPTAAEDTHRRPRADVDTALRTTLVRDDHERVAYMRRDAMQSDPRAYQRLRAEGFTVQQWSTTDDLPQHMQTKLALMEKSGGEA